MAKKNKLILLLLLILFLSAIFFFFISKKSDILKISRIFSYQLPSNSPTQAPALSPIPTPTPSPSSTPISSPSVSPPAPSSPQVAVKTSKVLDDICQQGYNCFFQKKYSKAIELENSIIQQDKTYYKAYNLKGIALCYSGNFKAGMENIDKALALNPVYDYARFNKALAYELFGYYDNALNWYDKCLENTDTDRTAWSYYGKASIYGRRGDVINTVKFLKLAISFDGGIKEYSKTEVDFTNVKNSKEFQDLIYK